MAPHHGWMSHGSHHSHMLDHIQLSLFSTPDVFPNVLLCSCFFVEGVRRWNIFLPTSVLQTNDLSSKGRNICSFVCHGASTAHAAFGAVLSPCAKLRCCERVCRQLFCHHASPGSFPHRFRDRSYCSGDLCLFQDCCRNCMRNLGRSSCSRLLPWHMCPARGYAAIDSRHAPPTCSLDAQTILVVGKATWLAHRQPCPGQHGCHSHGATRRLDPSLVRLPLAKKLLQIPSWRNSSLTSPKCQVNSFSSAPDQPSESEPALP